MNGIRWMWLCADFDESEIPCNGYVAICQGQTRLIKIFETLLNNLQSTQWIYLWCATFIRQKPTRCHQKLATLKNAILSERKWYNWCNIITEAKRAAARTLLAISDGLTHGHSIFNIAIVIIPLTSAKPHGHAILAVLEIVRVVFRPVGVVDQISWRGPNKSENLLDVCATEPNRWIWRLK